MLSLDQCRKIDPSLANLPDEELLKLRADLYDLGAIALETWFKGKKMFPTSHLDHRQAPYAR